MPSADEWIPELATPEVVRFIREHLSADPFEFSLKYTGVANIPAPVIAAQIQSRQKAVKKLPEWSDSDCIVFPPAQKLEQSSSEITAKYKASLISGDQLFDLTGGTGVDVYYLSKRFRDSTYIEKDEALCKFARTNFHCLGANINVIQDDAESFLSTRERFNNATWCYLDPSRRDSNKNRVISIHDCEPDASRIVPQIHSKGGNCCIKLSPMLDIDEAIRSIGVPVSSIHITSVDGEVKELILLINHESHSEPVIHTADLSDKKPATKFKFYRSEEEKATAEYGTEGKYLYESNAAMRKSGAFNLPAVHFSLRKAAPNTHLYFSDELHSEFPGRYFEIITIVPYRPKSIRKELQSKKANITVRNFPESVADIRKKTGLKDGGETYLFFFTDMLNNLQTAICRKVNTTKA